MAKIGFQAFDIVDKPGIINSDLKCVKDSKGTVGGLVNYDETEPLHSLVFWSYAEENTPKRNAF